MTVYFYVDKNVDMNRKNLPSEIYDIIRSRILEFKLLPGIKISDKDIASELKVSRTPVREALIRLVNHGLVTSLHNRGFTVRQFSIKDVEDIYTLREALENLAVKLAIPFFDDLWIEKFKRHLDEYPKLIASKNRQRFNQTDETFHLLIADCSNNLLLKNQLFALHDQLAVLRRHAHLLSENVREIYEEETYKEHKNIFNHMVERNEKSAIKAMSDHVYDAMKSVINALKE